MMEEKQLSIWNILFSMCTERIIEAEKNVKKKLLEWILMQQIVFFLTIFVNSKGLHVKHMNFFLVWCTLELAYETWITYFITISI